MKPYSSRVRLFVSTSALILCLFIYVVYRSQTCLVNVIAGHFLRNDQFISLRESIQNSLPVPGFFIYQIPGGLWVFAATLASYNGHFRLLQQRLPHAALPVLVAIGLELLQSLSLTDGTPDPWDAIVAIMGFLAARQFASAPQHFAAERADSFSFFPGIACVAFHLSLLLADIHA